MNTTKENHIINIPTATSNSKGNVKVGSVVRVKNVAKTYNGHRLASIVYNRIDTVSEIKGDRAVIQYNGTTVAALNVKDLYIV